MTDSTHLPARLLDAAQFTVERKLGSTGNLMIKDRKGVKLGSAHEAGNKSMRALKSMSDGLFFPSRPIQVRDRDGQPALWIKSCGVVRRSILTVHRPDRTEMVRLIGKDWASETRNTGYWIKVDDERAGEIVADKRDYVILDSAGTERARIEMERVERDSRSAYSAPLRTTLHTGRRLSEPFATVALAATILRHRA
ncbi:MAG: hypothetical protein GX610_09595 [Rhodococcus sp.]|nr:hypothetical protein [Rhodococcus sp. (in: high G+C Gram-positive bacteria)]